MVWPGGHGMVYGMVWWARNGVWYGLVKRHDIWYGLAGMAWYMLYGMSWRGMSWYVERHSITCFKALIWAIARSHVEWLMSGGGPVYMYLTRSQVEGLLHARSIHTYSSSSLWAGIVDRVIVNL